MKFFAENFIYLFFGINVITYLLYAWDKHLAIYKRSRVPEAILLILAFLFGAFGALCGMVFFNHKTKHLHFTITVPILLLVQLTLIVLWKVYWL